MTGRRARLLFVMLLLFMVFWWLLRSMLMPMGVGGKLMVLIPRGASAGTVGQILAAKRLIRSSFGFRLLARITGNGNHLKSGAYDMSPGMTPGEMLEKIAKGDVSARWVTFPEGFTIQQIAERLQAEGVCSADVFVQEALHEGDAYETAFSHPGESLEGYLFPNTYVIPAGTPVNVLIREMLGSFESKVTAPFARDIAASGMNLKQVVILASLIEREARKPKDRPLISAVLQNRLKKNMRLECDATILYALGRHKKRVYFKDLEIDSPYNTYRNAGLPPGPIANPGLDSIKAALHPADVEYLYYVARPDGSHIFSRTFEEHRLAKQIARGK